MELESVLSTAVSLTVIVGFFWGILRYLVRTELEAHTKTMTELEVSVRTFSKTITEFSVVVQRLQNMQYDLDKRTAVIEDHLDALHERLDDTNRRISVFCDFCSKEHAGDMPMHVLDEITTPKRRQRKHEQD